MINWTTAQLTNRLRDVENRLDALQADPWSADDLDQTAHDILSTEYERIEAELARRADARNDALDYNSAISTGDDAPYHDPFDDPNWYGNRDGAS